MSEENQVEENSKPPPASGKFLGCGCLAWTIAGVLFLLIAYLLLSAMPNCRPAARRIHCRNNLKQIGLALHNYHQAYGCYPPAYTVDEQGRPMHSWRVLILPFSEFAQGGVQYDFSQPWNSPDNIAFAKESRAYQIYCCPTEFLQDRDRPDTSYVMLVGPNAFADGSTARKQGDITDELGATIIVGEMSHSGIFWTEPRDLNTLEMSSKINDPNQIGLRSDHSGGLHVLFADGAIRFFYDPDPKLFKALITINGGEDMSEFPNW